MPDQVSKSVLQKRNSSLSLTATRSEIGKSELLEVRDNAAKHRPAPSSFAGLSLSAKKRTRLLMEVTAFVSAVSNVQDRLNHDGPDLLRYEFTVGDSKHQNKSWLESLYKYSRAWFEQVPDKELSLAVDILRRTRTMIRNRFSGVLAEKYCDLPARITFSCLRARNLEPRDYKHNPGSYCVMKMDGLMYRTSSQRSLNPVWQEEFEFIVQDVNSVMSISVIL